MPLKNFWHLNEIWYCIKNRFKLICENVRKLNFIIEHNYKNINLKTLAFVYAENVNL